MRRPDEEGIETELSFMFSAYSRSMRRPDEEGIETCSAVNV